MISSLLDWLRIQILYSAHISHQLITIHSTSAAAPPPLFLLVPFIFSSFRSCLYSNIFSKAPRWWEYPLQWALDKRGVRIYCSFYSVDSPQSLDTLDFSVADLAEEDGLQVPSWLSFLIILVCSPSQRATFFSLIILNMAIHFFSHNVSFAIFSPLTKCLPSIALTTDLKSVSFLIDHCQLNWWALRFLKG